MVKHRAFAVVFAAAIIVAAGCSEKAPPSRTEIPVIKALITRVESGVRDQNIAALDSVMSIKLIERQLNSDSLMQLVRSQLGEKSFGRFADCDIMFSTDVSKCDCRIRDDAGTDEGGILFTFAYADGVWLVTDFKVDSSDTK